MMLSFEAAAPAQVVVRRAGGRGAFHAPDGDHPLGALTYFVSSAGRGGLALQAGSGEVKLSGADADQTGPHFWRLKIDLVQIVTARRAQGTCDLKLAAGGVYRALDCKGVIGAGREPFALSWRGDGRPAQEVRPQGARTR